MAASAVEHDFFRLEKESSAAAKFHRRRSFRDIQSVISKLSPELLKSVIASGGTSDLSSGNVKSSVNDTSLAPDLSISVPSSPELEKVLFPLNSPPLVPNPESAPLTIFYNGMVSVFDFPSHKVEKILKFAGGGEDLKLAVGSLEDHQQQQQQKLVETISGGGGDVPMARKKSLQRFMQKRKQRASLACPYTFGMKL